MLVMPRGHFWYVLSVGTLWNLGAFLRGAGRDYGPRERVNDVRAHEIALPFKELYQMSWRRPVARGLHLVVVCPILR
eukprot:529518-Amphidinium_carterae.1